MIADAVAVDLVDELPRVGVADADSDSGGGLSAVEQRRIGFYAASAKAAATRRDYRGAWRAFTGWCATGWRNQLPASPQTVAAFLAYLADTGASLPTIVRHHAAIRHAHVLAGADLPTGHAAVAEVMAGIRRRLGRPSHGKDALLTPELTLLVAAIDRADPDRGLLALRDRALLLVGFATAMRRSDLSTLDWADVAVQSSAGDGRDGAALVFTIARSKTDQTGQGRLVGVLRTPHGAGRLCPVRALLAWRAALSVDLARQSTSPGGSDHDSVLSGPMFRPVTRHGHAGVPGRGTADRPSGAAIAQVVKRRARAPGSLPSPSSSATNTCRPPAATCAEPAPLTMEPVVSWPCDRRHRHQQHLGTMRRVLPVPAAASAHWTRWHRLSEPERKHVAADYGTPVT